MKLLNKFDLRVLEIQVIHKLLLVLIELELVWICRDDFVVLLVVIGQNCLDLRLARLVIRLGRLLPVTSRAADVEVLR